MTPPKNGWSKDRKFYNGKPLEHWERQAKKLVVTHLVMGSIQFADRNCLPREITSKELMALALRTDRVLVAEVLEERDQFEKGMAMTLASFLLPDNPRPKRKRKRKRA